MQLHAANSPRLLRNLACGGLVALAAAIGVGRFAYTPILPFMVEDLELAQSQAGLIASANFLGYLTGALAATARDLPGSQRAWLVASLGASALTTGAMALATSDGLFLLLRFAGGVASALVFVFASALVLDRLAAAGRPSLSALHFSGVGVGIALSAIVVSSVAASGFGWRAQWLACASASLLAVFAVTRLIPAELAGSETAPAPRLAGHAEGFRRLVAAYGLFGFGYVITGTFLVIIVRGSTGGRAAEPLVWLLVGVTAAPSVALWTWAGSRLGVYRTFALACAVEAAGVATSVLWLAPAGLALAAALFGGTIMGITALGLVGARRLAPGDLRRTMATMTAAFGLGQIIGPTFAGVAHDLLGSFLAPTLAAAGALLVAALLTVRLAERAR